MKADAVDLLEERRIRADERVQIARLVEDNAELFVAAGVDALATVRMVVLMIRLGGVRS